MHFSVLLFHTGDEDRVMARHYYEATSDDGANVEFQQHFSEANAEKEYKRFIKDHPKEKKTYPTVDNFMTSYYCYELVDGFYGSYSNTDGLYDWHEVGGRWSNLLPEFSNREELKKAVEESLDLNREEVKAKFRNSADEYIRIKSMALHEAATALRIGGCNSILISDRIPVEAILDWWIESYKADADAGHKNTYTRQNIINDVTDYIILEQNEKGQREVINGVSTSDFIEIYNYFVRENAKRKPMDRFYLTMLDLHT